MVLVRAPREARIDSSLQYEAPAPNSVKIGRQTSPHAPSEIQRGERDKEKDGSSLGALITLFSYRIAPCGKRRMKDMEGDEQEDDWADQTMHWTRGVPSCSTTSGADQTMHWTRGFVEASERGTTTTLKTSGKRRPLLLTDAAALRLTETASWVGLLLFQWAGPNNLPFQPIGGSSEVFKLSIRQLLVQLSRKICKTASEIRCPHPRATSLPTEVNALPNQSVAPSHLGALQPPTGARCKLYRSCVWSDFRTFLIASPCAPVPLWILQVHPSGIPTLALRASVQRLLSSSILLANTTRPMSDSSSSYLDTSL
ncbi:hypothetical protein Acr_09g0010380 [Actinidia rufa]|uniref:Uncharacterized protein n=1 Tax=Actinidia rufa TaxID=165716 RepID=A0A7J0F7C2_9ERIC|nr:hypothetical protein Acr_09g0010380 [Actinidia rufa]